MESKLLSPEMALLKQRTPAKLRRSNSQKSLVVLDQEQVRTPTSKRPAQQIDFQLRGCSVDPFRGENVIHRWNPGPWPHLAPFRKAPGKGGALAGGFAACGEASDGLAASVQPWGAIGHTCFGGKSSVRRMLFVFLSLDPSDKPGPSERRVTPGSVHRKNSDLDAVLQFEVVPVANHM